MSALLSAPATTSSVHKARGVASPTQVSYLERLGRVAADLCGLLAKETERLGHPELSVDQARPHPYDAGDPATLPSNVAWRASERLISVCETIIATAGSPVTRMTSMSMGFFDTSSLYFACHAKIPDYLAENDAEGLKGVAVEEIAAHVGTDAVKLVKVMRYLTTRHVFRETQDGFFANNRYSSLIMDDSPLKATIELSHELNFKPATRISDYLLSSAVFDPEGRSEETREVSLPHSLAFETKQTFFPWLVDPDHARIRDIFNRAMTQKNMDTTPGILTDLPWDELARKHGKFVDIGGGVGSLALKIVETYPQLSAVVQDQAFMIAQAKPFWAKNAPQGAKYDLQVFDFFKEQPVRDADFYVMRAVLHDWSHEKCAEILQGLKPALVGRSDRPRVFIIDNIVEPLVNKAMEKSGVDVDLQVPERIGTMHDIAVMNLCMMQLVPAHERTLAEWSIVMDLAGYRIIRVWPVRGFKQCLEIAPEPEEE